MALPGLELIDHRTGVRLYDKRAIVTYIETEYGSMGNIAIEKLRSRLESILRIRMDRLGWELRKRLGRVEHLREDAIGILETARGLSRIVWGNLRSAINLGGPKISGASSQSGKSGESGESSDQEAMSALG